jgi:hypothetical protein
MLQMDQGAVSILRIRRRQALLQAPREMHESRVGINSVTKVGEYSAAFIIERSAGSRPSGKPCINR